MFTIFFYLQFVNGLLLNMKIIFSQIYYPVAETRCEYAKILSNENQIILIGLRLDLAALYDNWEACQKITLPIN